MRPRASRQGRESGAGDLATEYVQRRDGNIYIGPSRVTIDSVVAIWQAGRTPEQIHESFPTAPLAYVYGAIAYHLGH
jgi:uncharacterized protein (DUF433 family)